MSGPIRRHHILATFVIVCFTTTASAHEPSAGDCALCQDIIPEVNSRWYAGAYAQWLSRDYPDSFLLARTVDRTATQIPGGVITLNDVSDFDPQAGLRVWLEYRLSDDIAIELSYFGLQEWNQSATIFVQDPPFANSPFLGNTIPFANKSFDTTMTVRYSSEIHNAELNLKRNCVFGNWNASALTGFRYFHLRERIDITGVETFTTTIEQTRTVTNNDLYGAQIGGELSRSWLDDRVGLAMNGKVGIFANNAEQNTVNGSRSFSGGSGTTSLDAGRSRTDFASLYEANVAANYRLTSHVSIRGGYQVLFIQNLALAPDQLALTGTSIRDFPGTAYPPGTGARIRTDGDLFLHGPFVGLDFSW